MERRHEPTEQLRVAVAQRQFAVAQRVRILAAREQHLVDAEVAATRRQLLRLAGSHGGPALGFLDQDFLDAADRPTLYEAIVRAAADLREVNGVDLQRVDRGSSTLRMVASLGFTDGFLARFRSLERSERTACVLAWSTRRPVMVDSGERSVIFAGSGALDPMMAAGSQSVYSYPLMGSRGEAVGVSPSTLGDRSTNRQVLNWLRKVPPSRWPGTPRRGARSSARPISGMSTCRSGEEHPPRFRFVLPSRYDTGAP